MTLVAISISAGSVGPILAGVGSTRAAAATPGSNAVASCEAVVRLTKIRQVGPRGHKPF
jgi:hypothetical protein